jgi:drug/metabolite transporter (DMT)-like permease
VRSDRRIAILSLLTAGVLWGASVPLSKVALAWLSPGWLTVGRFGLAAPLLAVMARHGLRDALKADVLAAGALGFGAVIVLQNLGIAHTSVAHAAVIVGAVPVLVAVFATALGHERPVAREWAGYLVASGGVVLVAGGGGGGATILGDLLVFASAALSSLFIVLQPRVLHGREAGAVTAVQFLGGCLFAVPAAPLLGGAPAGAPGTGPVLAFLALSLVGTIVPFWLFAFGQSRVPAQLAGVFVNIEPLVGAAIGWVAFADPAGGSQLIGSLAVLGGIVLTATPRTPVVLAPIARAWERGVEVHAQVLRAQRPWYEEPAPQPVPLRRAA